MLFRRTMNLLLLRSIFSFPYFLWCWTWKGSFECWLQVAFPWYISWDHEPWLQWTNNVCKIVWGVSSLDEMYWDSILLSTKLFYFRSQYKTSHCPRERFYLTLIKGSTRIQVMELLYCCGIAVGFKSLHLSVFTWQKISKISSSAAHTILLFIWCFRKAT